MQSSELQNINKPIIFSELRKSVAQGKLRLIGESGIFVSAKHKADLENSNYIDYLNYISVSFATCDGWIRLGKILPELNSLENKRIKITINASPSGAAVETALISINRLTKNGVFELVMRISSKLAFTKQRPTFTSLVKAPSLRSAADYNESDELYLFIEFQNTFEIANLAIDFEAVEPPPYEIPYVESTHPLARRLVENNARISRDARTARSSYLLDQAELAARLDCLDTAFDLLKHVEPGSLTSEQETERMLWVSTEVLIARGETDKLKDVLLRCYRYVAKSDYLFTALSICFPADDQHAVHFEKLPSGAVNRNYVSRINSGNYGLKSLRLPKAEIKDLNDAMLVASDLRIHSPSIYKQTWADFMVSYGLSPFDISTSSDTENIFNSIVFANRPKFNVDKKVSVIMSAYNADATIDYAMRSILDQSYANLELLVCDDRSSDNTLQKMKKFQGHPNVRLFQSNKNQGPYNIRSGLIAYASGDFITFQDADDFAHPQRLELQVAAIKDGKKFSMGRWVRIRPDGEIVFFRDQFCLRMCVVSLMVPRDIFDKFTAYRSGLCGGDSELYENIRSQYGADSIADINAPIILGLWSDRSLTRSDGIEATEDGFRSPSRRAYAEATARQRILGVAIIPDSTIDGINKEFKIYRQNYGISPIL